MTSSHHPTPTEREIEMAREIANAFKEIYSGANVDYWVKYLLSQLSTYGKERSNEAYEKAAKVADVHNANCVNAYCDVHIWVAKAIRQLKESK